MKYDRLLWLMTKKGSIDLSVEAISNLRIDGKPIESERYTDLQRIFRECSIALFKEREKPNIGDVEKLLFSLRKTTSAQLEVLSCINSKNDPVATLVRHNLWFKMYGTQTSKGDTVTIEGAGEDYERALRDALLQLLLAPQRHFAQVTTSNEDLLRAIDLELETVRKSVSSKINKKGQLGRKSAAGRPPNPAAMSFIRKFRKLYIACGGNDAVHVQPRTKKRKGAFLTFMEALNEELAQEIRLPKGRVGELISQDKYPRKPRRKAEL